MPHRPFLNVAKIDRLPQAGQWIARRYELMRYVVREISRDDTAHHTVPLHFLLVVEFMPSGNPACMVMPNPLLVGLDGVDQVALP